MWYSDSLRAGRLEDRIPLGRGFPRLSIPALGLTQRPKQWEPEVKCLGCGRDHTPFLASRLKKAYSYTYFPPLGLRGLFKGEIYLFTFVRRKIGLILITF